MEHVAASMVECMYFARSKQANKQQHQEEEEIYIERKSVIYHPTSFQIACIDLHVDMAASVVHMQVLPTLLYVVFYFCMLCSNKRVSVESICQKWMFNKVFHSMHLCVYLYMMTTTTTTKKDAWSMIKMLWLTTIFSWSFPLQSCGKAMVLFELKWNFNITVTVCHTMIYLEATYCSSAYACMFRRTTL